MIAVLTWPEWLWAGVPMFFVGWFGHAVFDAWERRQ